MSELNTNPAPLTGLTPNNDEKQPDSDPKDCSLSKNEVESGNAPVAPTTSSSPPTAMPKCSISHSKKCQSDVPLLEKECESDATMVKNGAESNMGEPNTND